MKKDDLLKHIAETAYNVGIGAKKHFSTYDIVDKAPGFIGFVSMAVGIFALFIDELTTKFMSASLIVLGIVGLYITFYDSKKRKYEKSAVELTKIFNDLKLLYAHVKDADEESLPEYKDKLSGLEGRYYKTSISKQILFSDWYAHYKFFWQHQISWIDEQLHFKFFRDKIPLTFSVFVISAFVLLFLWKFDVIKSFFGSLIT